MGAFSGGLFTCVDRYKSPARMLEHAEDSYKVAC